MEIRKKQQSDKNIYVSDQEKPKHTGEMKGEGKTRTVQQLAEHKKELLDKYKDQKLDTKSGSKELLEAQKTVEKDKIAAAQAKLDEKLPIPEGQKLPSAAAQQQKTTEYTQLEEEAGEATKDMKELQQDIDSMRDIIIKQKTLGPSAKAAVKLNKAVNEYQKTIKDMISAKEESEGIDLQQDFPALVLEKRNAVKEALSEVYEGLDLYEMRKDIEAWEAEVKKLEDAPQPEFLQIALQRRQVIAKLENLILRTRDQMDVLLRYGTAIDQIGTNLTPEGEAKAVRAKIINQIANEGVSNERIQFIAEKLDLPKIDSEAINAEKEAGDAVLDTMAVLNDIDVLLEGKEGLEGFREANAELIDKCETACWISAVLILIGVGLIILPICGILYGIAYYNQKDAEEMLTKIDTALVDLNSELINMENINPPQYEQI